MARLRTVVALLAGSALALAAPPAAVNAETFELQPQETRVGFTLGATMHTVHGTLRAKRGSVRFDPAPAAASARSSAGMRTAMSAAFAAVKTRAAIQAVWTRGRARISTATAR